MDIDKILSRVWSDGGAPPDETTVKVANIAYTEAGQAQKVFSHEYITASPLALEYYRREHAGLNIYYSPVARLETGEKITSSIVIDIDGGEFNAPDIIPFATVHTGNGEHAYIALDSIYTIEKITPVAQALNRYCGGDKGASLKGEYLRRYFEGYNYKTSPPKPIYFETSPRLVKYSLNDLANKAGLLFAAAIPTLPATGQIITPAPFEAAFTKLETALKRHFKLSRIYTTGGENTSDLSYTLALALLWRGFERGEISTILLHWSKGVAFSKNNPLPRPELLARISRIIFAAEKYLEKQGLALDPEALAIWNASSRSRGRGISEMKLIKTSGLSREDFKKGLAELLNKGLAEIHRENKTGKNSRRIIYVSRPENNLFAGKY